MKFKYYIYYFILVNLLFDFFLNILFPPGSLFTIFRAIINFSYFFYVIFILKVNIFKPFKLVTIILLYFFILILYSSDFSTSFTFYLKFTTSFLMLPISFYFLNSKESLTKLNKVYVFSSFLLLVYVIITFIFKIGEDQYGSGVFYSGNITGSSWNVVSYYISVLPLILLTTARKKRTFPILIAVGLSVFLILSLKRTSIISAFLAIVLFYTFSFEKIKTSIIIGFLGIIIVFIIDQSNFLKFVLDKQIQAREKNFTEKGFEKEGRYRETIIIWNHILSFENPKESLFGKELFNSVGHFDPDKSNKFMIHIDYNAIVHGSGLVGLFLYLLFYIELFYKFYKYKPKNKKDKYVKTLKIIFIIIVLESLLFSFSGQMYNITFRSIGFIYMGAILGNLKNIKKIEKNRKYLL